MVEIDNNDDDLSNSHSDKEKDFLAAFDKYADDLFRHAALRLNNRDLAVDVVHDTFVKTWSYLVKGYDIKKFKSFLYKILNNLIIDQYRKKKDMSLDGLLEREEVDESSFPGLAVDYSERLVDGLDGKKAFDLLDELPIKYREVIICRFVDQLKISEISQLLEESENVISVRLHRGLKILRKKIHENEEYVYEKRKIHSANKDDKNRNKK